MIKLKLKDLFDDSEIKGEHDDNEEGNELSDDQNISEDGIKTFKKNQDNLDIFFVT